jgi:hypothetical protein
LNNILFLLNNIFILLTVNILINSNPVYYSFIIHPQKPSKMNVIQRIKLTMYMIVKDCLNLNATIVANLPGYTANSTTFFGNIILIQSTGEQQEFDKSGVADNKKLLKQAVCAQADDISRKMVAYASITANTVLLKEIKYTKSELDHSSDADLKNRAQCIYDRANTNVAALATYGITPAILTAFLAAINTFNTAIPKAKEGIKEKKLTTAQLDALYDSTDLTLENIDKIVEIVRLNQPTFYKAYKESRKLPNASRNALSLKGSVSDAASGEYLKGATLTIALEESKTALATNGRSKDIVKKTAEKGGFQIKSLAAGTYQITIKKGGYVDQILKVVINDGEMTVLDIQLVKA